MPLPTQPMIINRKSRYELLRAIEERCYGKDAKYDVVSEIKRRMQDGNIYFESFNGCKTVKRPLVENFEVWSVALRRVRE